MRRGMRVAGPGLVLLLCILIGEGMLSCRRLHSASCLKVTALTRYRSRLTMRAVPFAMAGAAAAHKGERRHCGRVDEIRFFVNGSARSRLVPCLQRKPTCGGSTGIRIPSSGSAILPTFVQLWRADAPFDRSRVQYLCFAGLFRQQGVRGGRTFTPPRTCRTSIICSFLTTTGIIWIIPRQRRFGPRWGRSSAPRRRGPFEAWATARKRFSRRLVFRP